MNIDSIIHVVTLVAAGILAYIALYIRSTVQTSSEKAEARYKDLVRTTVAVELSDFGDRFMDKIAQEFVRSAKSTFTGAEIERRLEKVEASQTEMEIASRTGRHDNANKIQVMTGVLQEQIAILQSRLALTEAQLARIHRSNPVLDS